MSLCFSAHMFMYMCECIEQPCIKDVIYLAIYSLYDNHLRSSNNAKDAYYPENVACSTSNTQDIY